MQYKSIILFILLLTIQFSGGDAETLDTTKIGVEVDQQFDGYVVLVQINRSEVQRIFGQKLEDISTGDPTNSKTITNLDTTAGEVTIYNTNYGLEGWEGTYSLQSVCADVIYTDWEYWRAKHMKQMEFPEPIIHIIETEKYYGYIFEGNGSQTSADGITTITGHRQDCIYNKNSGFQEFRGLYEETYYSDGTEVSYTVQQFLLSSSDEKTDASLYIDLLSQINPHIASDVTIKPISTEIETTEDSSTPNTAPNLPIHYPFYTILSVIMLIPVYRKKLTEK